MVVPVGVVQVSERITGHHIEPDTGIFELLVHVMQRADSQFQIVIFGACIGTGNLNCNGYIEPGGVFTALVNKLVAVIGIPLEASRSCRRYRNRRDW
jgi:hypothetical protein